MMMVAVYDYLYEVSGASINQMKKENFTET